MHKHFKSPLLHFAIVVGGLLAWHQVRTETIASTVEVDERTYLEILARQARISGIESLSQEQVDYAIQEWVDEEILLREALRRGLHKKDIIVRRRLVQKMRALAEDATGNGGIVDDQEVERFYSDNIERLDPAATVVSYRHIYTQACDAVALEDLARRHEADPQTIDSLGDSLDFPRIGREIAMDRLRLRYGDEFAKALESQPVGAWGDMVQSKFGCHVVKVEARRAGARKGLADQKNRIAEVFAYERREESVASFLAAVRQDYDVEVQTVDVPEFRPDGGNTP